MEAERVRRREVLAASGLALTGVAGCSSLLGGSESTESGGSADEDEETATATPDPMESDGLRLWLRPSSISTSGGLFDAWVDESGNGYDFTQDTSESVPTVQTDAGKGNGALRFDGEDDYLLRDDALGIANDSPRTFVVVSRLTDPGARSPYLMQGLFDSTGGSSNYYGLEANTFNTAGERFGLYLISVGQDTEQSTNTAYNVHVLRTEDFTDLSTVQEMTTYYLNGRQVPFQSTPGNASNQEFEANSTAIGAFPQSDPGALMHGEIAEVAVYDRALDETKRTAIEEKLADKYGVQS